MCDLTNLDFRSGLALFLYSPHRPVRWVALSYPVLILLIIMVSLTMKSLHTEIAHLDLMAFPRQLPTTIFSMLLEGSSLRWLRTRLTIFSCISGRWKSGECGYVGELSSG